MKVYTFGYAGKRVADFEPVRAALNALVIDVRLSCRSRQPEWSGASLRRFFGSDYLHLAEFGNINYKNGGPILLADVSVGLEKLHKLDPGVIMLLCVCKNSRTCHRFTVVHAIVDCFEVEPAQLSADSSAARLGVEGVRLTGGGTECAQKQIMSLSR